MGRRSTLSPPAKDVHEYRVVHVGDSKARKFLWNMEQLAGVLLVLVDTLGTNIEHSYKIYQGKSKRYFSFGQIREILAPFVLSWFPETLEKELIFEKRPQTLNIRAVYKLNDIIEVEFQSMEYFSDGISRGLVLAEVTMDNDEILEVDGQYIPVLKKLVHAQRRSKMKRFTVAVYKSKTTLAPTSRKQAIPRKVKKTAAERLRESALKLRAIQ